jgi:hypothetical protein
MKVKMTPGTAFYRQKDDKVWVVVKRDAKNKFYSVVSPDKKRKAKVKFGENILVKGK